MLESVRASPSSYHLLMELRVDEQMCLLPIPEEVPIVGQEMSSVGDFCDLEIFFRKQQNGSKWYFLTIYLTDTNWDCSK